MIIGKDSLLHPAPEQTATDPCSSRTSDPLTDFDWSSLMTRYDRLAPSGDRQEYYHLVEAFFTDGLTPDAYTGLLCWKLGARFGPYRARRFLEGPQEPLKRLALHLPASLPRDADKVMEAFELVDRFPIEGMMARRALPMRSTLLHFTYPDVVPIFDTMVLRALGVSAAGANRDSAVLRQYLRRVWGLADRHAVALARLRGEASETPVRLVEMALWVIRDQ